MVTVTNEQLNQQSVTLSETFDKLNSQLTELNNVGYFGKSQDYSNAVAANPLQNQFPLLDWLRTTQVSRMMKNALNNGNLVSRWDSTNKQWLVQVPITWNTVTPPQDNTLCCWVPMDLAACADEVPLRLLCLKDCNDITDEFVFENQKVQSTDLINYFMQPGESLKDARRRMDRESMAFYTAYTLIWGMLGAQTGFTKPFHGIADIMSKPTVVHMAATDVLTTFDELGCRLDMLGGSNYVIAAHPLVINSIKEAIVPDRNGNLPSGWTMNGEDVTFHGIKFIADKLVPYDVENGTGDAWLLSDAIGVLTYTTLMPEDKFTRLDEFASTDDPSKGCASKCDFYYNLGTAMSANDNQLAVISNIPISTACMGKALNGLDSMIVPDTIVPA